MILSDLAATPWFQENLTGLLSTPLKGDTRVRHCLGLLAASEFKQCAEITETWLLAGDDAKALWHHEPSAAWLASAHAFALTVAVVIKDIVPPGSQKPSGPEGYTYGTA